MVNDESNQITIINYGRQIYHNVVMMHQNFGGTKISNETKCKETSSKQNDL